MQGIYQIRNKNTGKVYIGSSSNITVDSLDKICCYLKVRIEEILEIRQE